MKRAVTLLFALFLAGPVYATTVIPMSVEELTRAAAVIVQGRALESWPQWNPQHTAISTYTRFQPSRALKGSVTPEIMVKQPGGEVGPYGQRVPGVRQFQSGEEVVLFLRPSEANDGSYVIVGLMQGNFRMYRARSGDVAVTNGMRGVSQVEGRSVRVYTGTAMTLRSLESRVKRAQVE